MFIYHLWIYHLSCAYGLNPSGLRCCVVSWELIHSVAGTLKTVFPGSLAAGSLESAFGWGQGAPIATTITMVALGQAVPPLAVLPLGRPSSLPLQSWGWEPLPAAPRASCPHGFQLLHNWLCLNHLLWFPFSDGTVMVSDGFPRSVLGPKAQRDKGRWGPDTEPWVGRGCREGSF